LGKVIFHEVPPNEEIDIRKLKSGLYFIEVLTNKGKYFKKFVVSK